MRIKISLAGCGFYSVLKRKKPAGSNTLIVSVAVTLGSFSLTRLLAS
jgi:hypothetical protein